MRRAVRLPITIVFAAAILSACAATSAYAPQARPGGEGYFERRIDETHWRVEFVGGATTSAPIVERNLLFRAAELTRTSGYDWFTPSAHTTSGDDEIIVEAPRRIAGPNARWGPYWRRRDASGWSNGRPRGPGPVDAHRRFQSMPPSSVRYSARETIEMGRGDPPVNGFDAGAVADLLAPNVQSPH